MNKHLSAWFVSEHRIERERRHVPVFMFRRGEGNSELYEWNVRENIWNKERENLLRPYLPFEGKI